MENAENDLISIKSINLIKNYYKFFNFPNTTIILMQVNFAHPKVKKDFLFDKLELFATLLQISTFRN